MQREKLVVIGGSGLVGKELCRFGVALGHEIVSLSLQGIPSLSLKDDPWIEGVQWLKGDAEKREDWTFLEGAFSIVVCTPLDYEKLVNAAKKYGIDRLVFVYFSNHVSKFSHDEKYISVFPPDVISENESLEMTEITSEKIHVFQLWMALLRLSLEEDVPVSLSGDALLSYGDVVMLQ